MFLTGLQAASAVVVWCLCLPALLLVAEAQVPPGPVAAPAVPLAENVPPELQVAHELLMQLVDGVGRSARVSYERQGDVVKFRVDLATLTAPVEPVAEGELSFNSEGLTHFRIDAGLAYERHRDFKRRAQRLGLGNPEIEVLLDSEAPRLPRNTRATLAEGLPLNLLRTTPGEALVVEDVVFEGRSATTGRVSDERPTAAWRVAVRVGGAGAMRRFEVTVEPFGGAIIAIERTPR